MGGGTDTRVVQMQFENRQFERNIAQSKKSLADFKKELDFKSVSRGLESFADQVKNIDLGQLVSDVGRLADRFTGLGTISSMVMGEIQSKVRESIAAVSRFVDSMTVAQIDAGKAKYELLNKSVQTIKNATGNTEEEVYTIMERLNQYTDQTSYNFSDMAQNIGKFTSVGRGLDESERAMEGIANWAALSGAGINEASRAMYNISQAMGTGAMKLIDWRSIQNANMATTEFKQAVIDTAVATGDLEKEVGKDGKAIYKTAKKYGKQTEVTVENFADTLNKGWFTSDVMIKVLNEFGDTTTELGKKAYEAAQKCTTFTDVIQAWQDKISTGWMTTFRHIFGDLSESMQFFSDVCNKVGDDLDRLISLRNDILSGWAEAGGRKSFLASILGDYGDDVITGAYGLLDVIHDAGKLVANGFWDMLKLFAPGDVVAGWDDDDGKWRIAWLTNELLNFTERIQTFLQSVRTFFTEEVQIGDTTTSRIEMIGNVIRGLAGAFVFAYNVISGIVAYFHEIRQQLEPSFLAIENLFSTIGTMIYESAGAENKNKGILGFFTNLAELTRPLTSTINSLVTSAVELILRVIQWGQETGIFEKIGNAITKLYNVLVGVATPIVTFLGSIIETVVDLFENGINEDSIKKAGTKLANAFSTMMKGVADALPERLKFLKEAIYDLFGLWDPKEAEGRNNIFTKIHDLFTKGFESIKELFEDGTFAGIWETAKGFFDKGLGGLGDIIGAVLDWFDNLSLFDAVKGTVGVFSSVVGWLIDQLFSHNLFALVKAILGVVAVGKLTGLLGSAKNAFSAVGEFFSNPLGMLFGGGKNKGGGFGAVAEHILDIAKAIGIIAAAVVILGAIPVNQLIQGGIALTAILGIVTAFVWAVNKASGEASLKSNLNYVAIAGMALSIGLLVAALLPLALVSWEGLGRMVSGLAVILMELVGFMAITNKMQVNTKQLGGFIGFALSIAILVTSLLPLCAVSWESFGKMMAGLGGVLGQLIIFMLLTSKLPIGTGQLGGFIGFALSIAILMMSLLPLAGISWEGYGKMMAGLGGVLGQLLAFMIITSKLPIGTGQLGGFIAFAASIAILVLSLSSIANISWEGYAKMMATLGGILAQMVIFSAIMKAIKVKPSGMAQMLLFAAGISAIVLAFGVALGMTKGMDWTAIAAFAAGISVVMIAMAGAVAIIGNIHLGAAIKGIVALAAAIIVIGGALSLIIPVLMGSIGNSMQSMAGRLRLVGDLISQFTETMSSVSDGDLDSAQHKLDKIKDMMTGLSSFKGLEKNVDAFSTAMWSLSSGLAVAYREFNQVGDISDLSALQLLKEIEENYEGIDVLSKMNLHQLQTNLSGLGGAMMLYAMGAKQAAEAGGVSGVDEDAIDAAVQIMSKISESVVQNGGFSIPDMPSDTELSDWGVQMAALAGALVQFEEAGSKLGSGTEEALKTLDFFQDLKAKLVDTDAQTNLNWVASFMGGITLEVNASSGTAEDSVDVLTSFAAHIAGLGEAMRSFAEATTKVNAETGEVEPMDYSKATDALQAFMDIKEKLPEVGGIREWVTGTKKDLVDLGTEIEGLGRSLSRFTGYLTGENGDGTAFDPEGMKQATGALDEIVSFMTSMQSKLPVIGGLANAMNTFFNGREMTMTELGDNIGKLGDGLGKLGQGIQKGGWSSNMDFTTPFKVIDGILDIMLKLGQMQSMTELGGTPTVWIDNLVYILDRLTGVNELMTGAATGMTPGQSIIEGLTSFMAQLDMALEDVTPDTAKLESMVMVAEIINALSNVDVTKDFSVVGSMIANGTAQGIIAGTSGVINAAIDMAVAAYDAACKALDIHSPSKLFGEIGGFVATGMAVGIGDGTRNVMSASESMSQSAVEGARNVLRGMASILDGGLDANPTITPVIDMTGFNSGITAMQRQMGNMTIDTSAAGRFAMDALPYRSKQEINQNGSDYTGLYGRIERAVEQIDKLGEQMANMKLVLDSGVVAGGVTDDVDINLGRRMFYASRNN